MALQQASPKKIYIRVWENSSGIYRNQSEGLISISSDGTNWITITDKNLGATTPYTYGDTLSNANCGNIYQWGNNYGFTWSGGFTTSTTLVDASNYGPGNYYNSGIYVVTDDNGATDWSSIGNGNLWGDTTDTLVARRGPCASGYHIASKSEWGDLITTMTALGISTSSANAYSQYLKIPYNGYYRYDGENLYAGSWACLWSSSPEESGGKRRGWDFWFESGTVTDADKSSRASGLGIRPFKNTPEVPDSTWTVIYQPS